MVKNQEPEAALTKDQIAKEQLEVSEETGANQLQSANDSDTTADISNNDITLGSIQSTADSNTISTSSNTTLTNNNTNNTNANTNNNHDRSFNNLSTSRSNPQFQGSPYTQSPTLRPSLTNQSYHSSNSINKKQSFPNTFYQSQTPQGQPLNVNTKLKYQKPVKSIRSPLLPNNSLSHSHSTNFHASNVGSASHQRQYVLLRDKSDNSGAGSGPGNATPTHNHQQQQVQSPLPNQAPHVLYNPGSMRQQSSSTLQGSPMLSPSLSNNPPVTPTLNGLSGRKRPSLMRVASSSKYIFSVDDHEDEVEEDLTREYLEGYTDALRNRFKKTYAHGETTPSNNASRSNSNKLQQMKIDEIEDEIAENLEEATKELNVLKERECAPHIHQDDGTIRHNSSSDITNHLVGSNGGIVESDADQSDISMIGGNQNLDIEDLELDDESHHHHHHHHKQQQDDANSISSVESFTLRERQDAINETHPFGIRIWKPAVYKKIRSVEREAETDIHSNPQNFRKATPSVLVFNFLWKVTFGLTFLLICSLLSFFTALFSIFTNQRKNDSMKYCKLYINIGFYLFDPFGKIVCLKKDNKYIDEDAGVGTSLDDFRKWRTQNEERLFYAAPTNTSQPLNRSNTSGASPPKDTIPIANETTPLNLSMAATTSTAYNSMNQSQNHDMENTNSTQWETQQQSQSQQKGHDQAETRNDSDSDDYDDDNETFYKQRLFGRGAWNIGRVVFYFFFYMIIQPIIIVLGFALWLLVFTIPMSKVLTILASHVRRHPLALTFQNEKEYISKKAGAKHSNESILICTYRSLGWHYYKYTVDGTNIFFINMLFLVILTIFDFFFVKKYLGLKDWIFTDAEFIFVLCLVSVVPLAYFIGQAVASISAQSSMGVGAVINAFFSTVVEIFLYCVALDQSKGKLVEGSMLGSILAGVLLLPGLSMCGGAIRRKTQRYNPASAGVSSTMLMFSMLVMMAPTILYEIYGQYEVACFNCTDPIGKKSEDCKKCHFFQPSLATDNLYLNYLRPFTILCAFFLFLAYCIGLLFTLKTHAALIWSTPTVTEKKHEVQTHQSPFINQVANTSGYTPSIRSLSLDATGSKQRKSIANLSSKYNQIPQQALQPQQQQPPQQQKQAPPQQEAQAHGGHDAPNWSRTKSTTILLTATVLYAIIAEILVDVVDDVLSAYPINPKFLGLTIFALVPNTTEFVNAISFAIHGNVALSMEIGSAYALQVCLLQIPVVTVYSYFTSAKEFSVTDISSMFTLIFPRWDFFASLISVYMFTYIYAEGKSNYFKGSILILLYFVVMAGFYYSDQIDTYGLPPMPGQFISPLY